MEAQSIIHPQRLEKQINTNVAAICLLTSVCTGGTKMHWKIHFRLFVPNVAIIITEPCGHSKKCEEILVNNKENAILISHSILILFKDFVGSKTEISF